ncbi:isoprenylcysteine carboxylmethyltransferase family protein [Candidatus Bathyarchaeota archaeon]|nr:isoprenylcysteine carboxylmethyltransferase family protein [Candidatus Bathyarchaeota archaeon]
MTVMVRERVGEEHPWCDRAQAFMFLLFIAVWGLDSYYGYTACGYMCPWALRVAAGLMLLGFGGYLVSESHKLVIEAETPGLVDWGVYALVRHPMYLGMLVMYLGLGLSTLSAASMALWAAFFYAYDRFAEYEERSLLARIGGEYRGYMARVRRWAPSRSVRRG